MYVAPDALQQLAYRELDWDGSATVAQIPTTFREFFRDFGGIEHDYLRDPKTHLPSRVTDLAEYQYEFAEANYAVMLKTNKSGMTTSEMLCDYWTRLLPQNAGFDCLLAASKQEIANELLMQLKTLVANSRKYSQYLITDVGELGFKERKSKMRELYVANPYNPKRPSRIIAIGSSLTDVYSRMKVNRIHITDPSRMVIRAAQTDYFAGLFSRISNTGGDIKIEGVPGKDRSGWFWLMCKKLFNLDDRGDDAAVTTQAEQWDNPLADYELPDEIAKRFATFRITIDDAVSAGVIPARVRSFLHDTLSPAEFRRTCMAEFPLPAGAAFGGPLQTGDHDPELWD